MRFEPFVKAKLLFNFFLSKNFYLITLSMNIYDTNIIGFYHEFFHKPT